MIDPTEELKTLTLDVRANNPDNYIKEEVIPIKDKTCKWLVTNGSPFFIKDFILKTGEGAIVNPSKYKLCGDYIPLIQLTGKRVVTFIEITDPLLLENNDSFKVTYRSTGENFIPRNSIDFWLERIREGNVPLEWDNVFGKPVVYPIDHHSHDVYTEIADFDDVIDFIKMVEGSRWTRSDTISDELRTTMDEAVAQLLSIRTEFMAIASDHDSALGNPHGIKAEDIDLGNVDNFKTATIEEDIAGVSSTLFSTPQGAKNLVLNSVSNDVSFLENGVFPVSLAGGGDYIPPNISGSFEGLGGTNAASSICLEPNGRLMVLTCADDGRPFGKGIYYSYIENFHAADTNSDFQLVGTGMKYGHPTSGATELDTIITGDGNKVLMVGETGTSNWFITITNNTLDRNQHVLSKCSISNVLSRCPDHNTGGGWNDNNQYCSVHYAGDYVVLIVPHEDQESPTGAIMFFRIPTSDIINGVDTTWQQFNVSGVDAENNSFSSRESLIPWVRVGPNGDGKYTSNYHKFKDGFDNSSNPNVFGWSICSYYDESQGFNMRISGSSSFGDRVDGVYKSFRPAIEFGMNLDPSTGLLKRNFASQVRTTTVAEAFDEFNTTYTDGRSDRYGGFHRLCLDTKATNLVVLPDGSFVGIDSTSAGTFPLEINVIKPTNTSAKEIIKTRGDLVLSREGTKQYRLFSSVLNVLPGNTSIHDSRQDGQNDLFCANENVISNPKSFNFIRYNSGGFSQRSSVKYGSHITYSRPLTNEVYKLNIDKFHGSVRYSDDTDSGAIGNALGEVTWSTLILEEGTIGDRKDFNDRSYYDVPGKGINDSKDNIDWSFPKEHTYQPNVVDCNVISTSYYGINNGVVDSLMSSLATVTGVQARMLTIFMLDNLSDPAFKNKGLGLVQYLGARDGSSPSIQSRVALVKFTISRKPAAYPNTDVLTGFNVLDDALSNERDDPTSPVILASNSAWTPYGCNIYKSGSNYEVHGFGSIISTIGTSKKIIFNLTMDSGVDSFTSADVFQDYWKISNSNKVLIKKQGLLMEEVEDTVNARCYTMDICSEDFETNTVYAASTIFPNPLWVLFFNQGIKGTINGTKYDFPQGQIDLRDVKADPSNSVFYVFMTVDENGPNYRITTNKLKQHNLLLLVAKATTNASQVTSIEKYQPCLIANRELTPERKHGAIVHSTGLPMDQGQYSVVRNSDLT